MIDLDMDGIPDGAEVKLKRKTLDPSGAEQFMEANWRHRAPEVKPGGGYAGEERGGFSNVGAAAAGRVGMAGGDVVDQSMAGERADRGFQPVSLMDAGGRRAAGRAGDVIREMEAPRPGFGGTDASQDYTARRRMDDFEERSRSNYRIMTGGRTSESPGYGTEMERQERAARADRMMNDGSMRPDQRRNAAGVVSRFMDDEQKGAQRVTDERIQELLSGGKVKEAEAAAGGQVGAAQFKAAGDTATAEAESIRADRDNQARIAIAEKNSASRERVAETTAESRERMAKERNSVYLEGRKMMADARKETDPQKLRNTLNRMEQHNFGSAFGQPQSIGQYVADAYDPATGELRKTKADDGTEKSADIDIAKEAHLDAINELRGRLGMPPLFQRADERGNADSTPPKASTPGSDAVDTVAIRGPDGTVRRVPRANAQKYIDKGGVVVE